ncbi:MAG: ABC transporter ATP-binding protein [Deltaproteobacteria bacterium]|nr:ABC transporter ATP-binding protein [Deltaproteobacteria bacterium]
MEKNPVFEISKLSYRYADSDSALKSINMVINKGESVAVLGANGSGKSTLLKLLDGLYFPTEGQIRAFNTIIDESTMKDKKFAREFHTRVGLVFQDPDVQLFLPTVWDEVAFAPLQLGMSKSLVTEKASTSLEMLGIYELKDRTPYHLSEGEKKKVALASILALDPEVWLLDEPTSSLDPRTQGWIIDFILELSEKGKTVVTATHDLEIPYVAARSCYVLGQDHEIMASGPSRGILDDQHVLAEANLIHRHRHFHKNMIHTHIHRHWD